MSGKEKSVDVACSKVVLGKSAASGTKGSVYLGRPWGDYARVVFQNSNLENMITSAHWEGNAARFH